MTYGSGILAIGLIHMSISYDLTLGKATFADGSDAGGGEARAGCWREGEREKE